MEEEGNLASAERERCGASGVPCLLLSRLRSVSPCCILSKVWCAGFALHAMARDVLEEYILSRCGKRVIRRVLIANNGIAAVKAIRSIRRWAYLEFSDEKVVTFVAMATPDDLGANAEYLRMADEFVEVPGGRNIHNYANVDLIVDIAVRMRVDGVWAGWGHASENPALPNALRKRNIAFLGPPAEPMAALGDKIASTIVAQDAAVPCLPWSGNNAHTYDEACVRSSIEAVEHAERIGYPLMIKASEGGGGKGIRKCLQQLDVEPAFRAVSSEVPGSPIFVMKMLTGARHLEVQVLADEHGNAISLRGRDCSVQRRHQKIIEEGPAVAAPPETLDQMEAAAVRLAKSVGYSSVGTVEYLYLQGKFYFLELNPRLQVEHPVTEWITGVNLPACQYLVACGVRLDQIPDIRRLYGEPDVYGRTAIDFSATRQLPPKGHVVAVRITAENPEEGFQPSSGTIQDVTFRSNTNVWGYFSVGSTGGGVHQFADSQFGHIFAWGETRDQCRKSLVMSLKELVIRGDIRTTVEYLILLLERPEFVANTIDTTWLDGLIEKKTITQRPRTQVAVIGAALHKTVTKFVAQRNRFMENLKRGQVMSLDANSTDPSAQLFQTSFPVSLTYEGWSYELRVTFFGQSVCFVENVKATSPGALPVKAYFRFLRDGSLLYRLGDGRSHVSYGKQDRTGLRLTVGSHSCFFPEESDPTRLRSTMPGKIVRQLRTEGQHVAAGEPYLEVEVMKMYMQLKAPLAGTIKRWLKAEGVSVDVGDVLASLDVDDPSQISKTVPFTDPFESDLVGFDPEDTTDALQSSKPFFLFASSTSRRKRASAVVGSVSPTGSGPAGASMISNLSFDDTLHNVTMNIPQLHMSAAPVLLFDLQGLRDQMACLENLLAGYVPPAAWLDLCVEYIVSGLEDLRNPRVARAELAAKLSVLKSSLPKEVMDTLQNKFILNEHFGFDTLAEDMQSPDGVFGPTSVAMSIPQLAAWAKAYVDGARSRQAIVFRQLLNTYLAVEMPFNNLPPSAFAAAAGSGPGAAGRGSATGRRDDALFALRDQFADNLGAVFDIALARSHFARRRRVMLVALDFIEKLELAQQLHAQLEKCALLTSKLNSEVSLSAKRLLMLMKVESPRAKREWLQKQIQQLCAAFPSPSGHGSSERLSAIKALCSSMPDVAPESILPLMDSDDPRTRAMALEIYIRRLYRVYSFGSLQLEASVSDLHRCLCKWTFLVDDHQWVPHRHEGIVGAMSVDNLSALNTSPVASASVKRNTSTASFNNDPDAFEVVDGLGVLTVCNDISQVRNVLGAVVDEFQMSGLSSSSGHGMTPPSSARRHWGGLTEQSIPIRPISNSINVIQLVLFVAPWQFSSIESGAGAGGANSPASSIPGPSITSLPPSSFGSGSRVSPSFSDAAVIAHLSTAVKSLDELLRKSNVRRVTVVVVRDGDTPRLYTFRQRYDYSEDPIYRHVEPTLAYTLHLRQLDNFNVRLVPLANNAGIHGAVHVYFGKSKPERMHVLGSSGGPLEDQRFFVRTVVSESDIFGAAGAAAPTDFQFTEAERIVVESLNALELAMGSIPEGDATYMNNVFIHWRPAVSINCEMVRDFIAQIAQRHAKRLLLLRVTSVEARITFVSAKTSMKDADTDSAVDMRFFASNRNGLDVAVDVYTERPDGRLEPAAGTCGPLAGMDLNTPYPIFNKLEQRRLVAHRNDTVFAYDYPHIIEREVRMCWSSVLQAAVPASAASAQPLGGALSSPEGPYSGLQLDLAAGSPMSDLLPKRLCGRPLVSWEEYIVDCESQEAAPCLVPTCRPAGENDVGMVVWKMQLATPEAEHSPSGYRSIVVIANDITFQSGSFSVAEDRVYMAACALAEREGIPRIYLSANSGARIGLADEVKRLFRASFSSDSSNGSGNDSVDGLYLTPEDYRTLSAWNSVKATLETLPSGEQRYRITDIIGRKDGLGVENLKGSGMIAGCTSRLYKNLFTLSIVSGRSVGIGAYIVRLGHRVIQVGKSPILLTGAAALNKVLGRSVYQSNVQIGGPQVMHTNGVSHLHVADDIRAVRAMLRWLSFVPLAVGHAVATVPRPLSLFKDCDPSRPVEFAPPVSGSGYDPRWLVAGAPAVFSSTAGAADDGGHCSGGFLFGMFDRDSFQETMDGWASNVVTGRARLGGIPCGVVCVETRPVRSLVPADPADELSQERAVIQAGQVWYPNSAFKTAEALRNFDNGEQLPVVILANWRGFSGGMRDMFEEVLKFGSLIVDALSDYKQPVMVYLPPFAELRGGAWVVVDPAINPDFMEMYADPQSRGGVLEPDGVVEIKFRDSELRLLMTRLDAKCAQLARRQEDSSIASDERSSCALVLAERQKQLMPVYRRIAEIFADLHDTPGRMLAKDCIRGVVPWTDSRRYFHHRMLRLMLEEGLCKQIREANPALSVRQSRELLAQWVGLPSSGSAPVLVEGTSCLCVRTEMDAVDRLQAAASSSLIAQCLEKARVQATIDRLARVLPADPERAAAVLGEVLAGLPQDVVARAVQSTSSQKQQ